MASLKPEASHKGVEEWRGVTRTAIKKQPRGWRGSGSGDLGREHLGKQRRGLRLQNRWGAGNGGEEGFDGVG
jgi:hypothetical protein